MPNDANVINLEAHRRPTVRVERMPDAKRPGRTEYRITGTRCADVQDQINSLVDEVEQHCIGFGRFVGPHYIGNGCYVALGEIIHTTETP